MKKEKLQQTRLVFVIAFPFGYRSSSICDGHVVDLNVSKKCK